MLTKKTVIINRVICDICKREFNRRNASNNCLICDCDICINCSYELRKTVKKKYSTTFKQLGRLCSKCFNKYLKKRIKGKGV